MAPADIQYSQEIPPSIVEPHLLEAKNIIRKRSGGAAPADIQYSQALNMQGQIARATPLSQLFIYMNNCLQFLCCVGELYTE